MIAGIGTDIVEIDRIRRIVEKHGQHFLERILRPAEIELCTRSSSNSQPLRYERIAGRFAAKEALSKAFGTGISEKIHFQNIEITNTSQGCPVLKLCEAAESLRLERGISKIHLSISHADHYATASVVLESDSHPPT